MSFSAYSNKNSSSLLRNVNNETSILTSNISLPIIQITSESLVIMGMVLLLLLIDFSVTIITIINVIYLNIFFIIINI